MRRLRNTLYVTTDGAWLRKEGENIVMEVEGETRARLPVHMLEGLVCIGRVMISPALMGHCAASGICVSFLSPNGRFLARVEGPVSGNVLLRRAQYRRSDDPAGCADLVRHLLVGKLHNQRAVLARALRDHAESMDETGVASLVEAVRQLGRITQRLFLEPTVDGLRGLEGEAAQRYFAVFDHLIRVPHPSLRFTVRSRRPPRDAMNALLSYLYTLLVHDCRGALESVGLDPAVGFLHRDRPGRPSLALDLMEAFRPVLADRLALSLINLRQVTERDFIADEGGAVHMREDARKTLLMAWQERKREERKHAFLEEKMALGLFPFVQSQLLARHLRGDLDAYPPFLWK